MISQIGFRRICPSRKQTTIVLCSTLILIAITAFFAARLSHAANHRRQHLTFEDRVAAQRAIEEVYWRHRLWPKENPQPKPPLSEAMPEAAIRAKVEDYLRKSMALEVYWQRPVSAEQLQAEMERQARQTKQPEVLRELWAAIGNDPLLIAECLARPVLVERLLRNWYAADERLHGELKRRAAAELNQPDAAHRMREMSGEYRETEWRFVADAAERDVAARDSITILTGEEWRVQMEKLVRLFPVRSTSFSQSGLGERGLPLAGETTNTRLPQEELSHLQEDEERFYAMVVLEQGVGRARVGTVEWRKAPFDEWWSSVRNEVGGEVTTSSFVYQQPEIEAVAEQCEEKWKLGAGPPSGRSNHTAVWTGSEMVVWGGRYGDATGGRYNPATDTWIATGIAGAPSGRVNHTVVWTGSEMIVWGGYDGSKGLNTGGRYNPINNTWRAISIIGAPSGRSGHTAVWAGSEMIVWGGYDSNYANTGGRYNPATDTWTATSTIGAPSERLNHSAVWAFGEMIIWGGDKNFTGLNTGGRYNPATNTWKSTSLIGTPTPQLRRTVVWTGSEMIIWGGDSNMGGRYNPTTDTWRSTSDTGAPERRFSYTAVWTGAEMIVWGGSTNFPSLNTGGRYNPVTDTWRPTNTSGAPSSRGNHTAVWTGSEMIIWGGQVINGARWFNSGGRYNPATDTWVATSTAGAPSGRSDHTAVWTGSEMIVWGGFDGDYTNTGGRYNPATDTWRTTSTLGAPSERVEHTVVWTGSEMIIWGGGPSSSGLNTGGRYNPATDTWILINTTGAPSQRSDHAAVWTGNEMIVWGGSTSAAGNYFNTGGRYSPVTDTWTSTSITGAPGPRRASVAVWTGSEMIVWGGFDGNRSSNTGGRYHPATDKWTSTSTTGAPSARSGHTMVWTGSEAIVWGDADIGGRYNPATNTWTSVSTIGAPSRRFSHTAVWTGSEMIVWGGYGDGYDIGSTGGRYNPATDAWRATSTTNAPTGRGYHTAVWTGSEMIIWGGDNGGPVASYTLPSILISPGSQVFTSAGGTGIVTVTAGAVCSWVASSEASWITVISGGNGSGNGTVNYSVASNATAGPRTGILLIAGQPFTVTQTGCASISPTSRSFEYTGGTGSITVVAASGCSWAASSPASWVIITSGSSGSGNGTINYSVGFNIDASPRSTTLTIAGQSFSISQSGAPGPFGSPLTVDDGTPEDAIGVSGGGTLVGVNRLTPTSYPATLTHVAIFFNLSIPADIPFTLFAGANVSGGTNIDGIVFQTAEARIRSADNRFNIYAVPRVTINSGDFVVGLRITHIRNEFPLTIDKTPPSQRRSYISANGITFTLIDNLNVPLPGNFMIRAYWDRPPCHTVTSINPLSGASGANVAITGTNFIGVTGVKFANNVAAMFTVNSDTQITATVPSGAVTGSITISKAGCADAQTGTFTVLNPGYEADVMPRPTGSNDGAVTASDWTQIGRFVAGLDTPANGSEFQRADCAPRATLGDGRLTTADWVQAGRYAAGSDPVVAAGGPIAPSGLLAAVGAQRRRAVDDGQRPTNREPRAIRLAQAGAGEFTVEIEARGDENALGFSLQFDPAVWRFVSVTAGRDAQGAALRVNAAQAARGRIGVALALTTGHRLNTGARQVVIVRLAARSRRGTGAIGFGDYPVMREVVDVDANVLPAVFDFGREAARPFIERSQPRDADNRQRR